MEEEHTEQPLGRARGGEAVVPRSRREDVGYVHPSNAIPREKVSVAELTDLRGYVTLTEAAPSP